MQIEKLIMGSNDKACKEASSVGTVKEVASARKVRVFNDEGIEVVSRCGPHSRAFNMDVECVDEGVATADCGAGPSEGGGVDGVDGV
nr:hypothetical protein [Hordeum vulgare subsp. vulgare]